MRIAIIALSLGALFAINHAEAGASWPAIARVWHGRVSAARADEYAKYLAESIKKFRAIPGNRGYQMMREDAGTEAHFMVISFWSAELRSRRRGTAALRTRGGGVSGRLTFTRSTNSFTQTRNGATAGVPAVTALVCLGPTSTATTRQS